MLSTLIQRSQSDSAEAFDYLFTLRRSEWNMPEEKLAAAVLEDAIAAYRGGASILGSSSREETARRKDAQAREARQWLESDERDYAFAFVPVCEALRIEPEWLRMRVLTLGPVENKWRRERK